MICMFIFQSLKKYVKESTDTIIFSLRPTQSWCNSYNAYSSSNHCENERRHSTLTRHTLTMFVPGFNGIGEIFYIYLMTKTIL